MLAVPSSSIILASSSRWSKASQFARASAISAFTFSTALSTPLPTKRLLSPIAQFDGFVLAGGCAAGNDGPAHGSVGEKYFSFYGRIAA